METKFSDGAGSICKDFAFFYLLKLYQLLPHLLLFSHYYLYVISCLLCTLFLSYCILRLRIGLGFKLGLGSGMGFGVGI